MIKFTKWDTAQGGNVVQGFRLKRSDVETGVEGVRQWDRGAMVGQPVDYTLAMRTCRIRTERFTPFMLAPHSKKKKNSDHRNNIVTLKNLSTLGFYVHFLTGAYDIPEIRRMVRQDLYSAATDGASEGGLTQVSLCLAPSWGEC